MPTNLKNSKSELRSDLLQQIRNTPTEKKQKWSKAIQQNLRKLLSAESGFWGAYQALSDEPHINWSQVSDQVQWCFPQVQNQTLQFRHGSAKHQRSSLGVHEPVDGDLVSLEQLKGVIVPGVGFSHKGHRLGRGKGFYDQTFAENFNGKKIGVCFELSLKPEIPNEEHDILLQQIVTESAVYQVGEAKWN